MALSIATPAAPSPHPTITLLKTSSLASVAQSELERMILSGELPPGEKLTEVALATRLGVSRGPLREAFRMLEEAGLVRTEKNRGVFVRDLPVEEAVEIFELRAAMDALVGRRLAERITPAELKEIRAVVDRMADAVKSRDEQAYRALYRGFHDRLVELAGNVKLAAVYRKLVKELSLFRQHSPEHDRMLPASVGDHRQIVRAIASGDVDVAGRALFDHAMNCRDRAIRGDVGRGAGATPAASKNAGKAPR